MKPKENPDLNIREQAIAAQVSEINSARIAAMLESLSSQDSVFAKALGEIIATREFIARPQNILGSDLTKHGEIAEHMEVGWRRAWDFLHQEIPTATFDGVHRTAPEDYKIDGVDVQSKFLNGAKNTLDAVKEHFEKYSYWKDGDRFYHIPKDLHQQMCEALAGGTPDGLSDKTAEQLRVKIDGIVELSGRREFDEVIQSSRYSYSEVQLGRANKTLDIDESKLSHENDRINGEIRAEHEPSLAEGLQSAAYGAAFAATISLGYGVYRKAKEGKSIYAFTGEDWQEIGLKAGSAGLGGGVTGATIYTLTNFADCSAPFAAAFVSTVRGTITQIQFFNEGKISQGELVDNSAAIASEAAICGLCAVIGQGAIPVPVVGAVIGSISGKILSGIYTTTLGERSKQLVAELDRRFDEAMSKLDKHYQSLLREINADFDKLGDLIQFAFSPENNWRLMELSTVTAQQLRVPEDQIIRDHGQLDKFLGH